MKSTASDLDALLRIDEACEAFEAEWKQGAEPRIHTFVERVAAELRSSLVHELVALEVELRCERGEPLVAEKLVADYVPLLPPSEDRESSLRSTIDKALTTAAERRRVVSDIASTVDFAPAKRPIPLPTIEGFEIESVLGRGGMGVVFKATQKLPRRPVALKMILDDRIRGRDSAEFLDRFFIEAQAIADLNDPHFVQIYTVGESDGRPYMALEFIEGGTLEQYRRSEPQPDKFAAETVETLARGMHKSHSAHVVHRDLKPQNILLTGRGVPKIADFGLVKRLDQEQQLTEDGRGGMGTPSYMAPEQTYGGKTIGPAADIYALGAILYCLLTGRPPFQGSTRYDVIEQVRRQEPVSPRRLNPKVARDLETICLKCLHKEPQRRYETAEALADDLRRFLEGRPINARPVSRAEIAWRWAKRSPVVAGLSSAVALLIVAVAVISTTMAWQLAGKNQTISTQLQEIGQKSEALETSNGALREQRNTSLGLLRSNVLTIDDELRNDVGQSSLRKRLIDLTMQGLDRLRDSVRDHPVTDPDDPLISRTEAIAHQRIGEMYLSGGRVADAAEAYQRALEFTEALHQKDPLDPVHIRNLAAIHNVMGDVQLRRGDTHGAQDHYQQGLELREQWIVLVPVDKEVAERAVAVSHALLARAEMRLGRPTPALEHLREAITIYDALPQPKLPRDAMEFRRERADYEQRLGEACSQLGRSEEARQHYEEALRQRTETANAYQRHPQLVRDEALSYLGLGTFELLDQRSPVNAYAHFEQAFRRFRALNARFPSTIAARDMASVHYRLGATLLRMRAQSQKLNGEEPPDPLAHFEEARRIREDLAKIDPQDIQSQIEWALAAARCGQMAEAQKAAAELFEQAVQQRDAYVLFQVACTFALCSASADPAVAEVTREKARDALHALRDTDWQDLVALRNDPDLDPLRSEPWFIELTTSPEATSQTEPHSQGSR